MRLESVQRSEGWLPFRRRPYSSATSRLRRAAVAALSRGLLRLERVRRSEGSVSGRPWERSTCGRPPVQGKSCGVHCSSSLSSSSLPASLGKERSCGRPPVRGKSCGVHCGSPLSSSSLPALLGTEHSRAGVHPCKERAAAFTGALPSTPPVSRRPWERSTLVRASARAGKELRRPLTLSPLLILPPGVPEKERSCGHSPVRGNAGATCRSRLVRGVQQSQHLRVGR